MKFHSFYLIGRIALAAGTASASPPVMGPTCYGLEKYIPPAIAGTPLDKEVACEEYTEGRKEDWGRSMVAIGGPSSRVTMTIATRKVPVAEWGDASQHAKAAADNEQVIALFRQTAGADPASLGPMLEKAQNTRFFTVAKQTDSMLMWDKEKGRATLMLYISANVLVTSEYPASSPDEGMTIAKDIYQKGGMGGGLASYIPK